MKVPVSELKHHPLNKEIYTLSSIDELMDSIRKVGLLQPLTIDSKYQVVSGNRRFEAVKRLKWEVVEVTKMNVKKDDEVLMLIHFNKQRVKSIKEILKEYDHLLGYYKEKKVESSIKIRSIRETVSDDIHISDGQLARILFVRKHNPEMIDLIEKQILTVNQAYLQSQRSHKERQMISENTVIKGKVLRRKDFVFYQKSSDRMDELKEGEVNVIYSSPPFYKKRLYSSVGELGGENSSDEYVNNIVCHLKDCYRVLNKNGSFFLNLGDTFVDGNLQNIPHKIVIKLQEQGWILRNTIIWAKTNAKPSSSKSNLNPSYEFVFFFTKSKDYCYVPTLTSISEKTKPSLPPRHRTYKMSSSKSVTPYLPNPAGKNIGDYWSEDIVRTAVVNQKRVNGIEHPSMFPEQIVYLPLLQTVVYPFLNVENKPPLVVCDPFAGSLTVYNVVRKINEEYGTGIRFVGYDTKKYFL